MGEQLIIAVSREFGSGGHAVAQLLSEKYNIPLYDSNLLEDIADQKNLDAQELGKYDEKSKASFFTRSVRGFSTSLEENLAWMQFKYLNGMADEGKSFVIVGRCAEEVLKENPNLVTVFVLGNMENKIHRIMERYQTTRDKAVKLIEQQDKKRKTYHNRYCQGKWGDSRNYDICINSRLGVERTAQTIADYIDGDIEQKKQN